MHHLTQGLIFDLSWHNLEQFVTRVSIIPGKSLAGWHNPEWSWFLDHLSFAQPWMMACAIFPNWNFSSASSQTQSRRLDWLLWFMVIWLLNNNGEVGGAWKLLILTPIWFVIVSRVMSGSRWDINRQSVWWKNGFYRSYNPRVARGQC